MPNRVIKKGGQIETFDPEKIKKSLNGAFENLDILPEKKSEIIEKVFHEVNEFLKRKKEITTAEIEAKILLELDKISPEAATNWRKYRLKKQK